MALAVGQRLERFRIEVEHHGKNDIGNFARRQRRRPDRGLALLRCRALGWLTAAGPLWSAYTATRAKGEATRVSSLSFCAMSRVPPRRVSAQNSVVSTCGARLGSNSKAARLSPLPAEPERQAHAHYTPKSRAAPKKARTLPAHENVVARRLIRRGRVNASLLRDDSEQPGYLRTYPMARRGPLISKVFAYMRAVVENITRDRPGAADTAQP
jgi:hypothetical protein